jgi:hypothetical protein
VIEMGYTRKRVGKDGKTRFMALYYDAQGKRRSAGTHATEKEAAKAWQKAEVKIGEGTPWDPRRGRQTFRRYVEEQWLPHHRIEASTRQGYLSVIYKHLMPYFGDMKLCNITPQTVREWITHLKQYGASPWTIQYSKVGVLNAIFTTAISDHLLVFHPSRGVPIDPVPAAPTCKS